MNIYDCHAGRCHDQSHLEQVQRRKQGHIKLRPLSGQFDVIPALLSELRSVSYWQLVFSHAAFFSGYDPVLFGHVITVVYKSSATNKLCAVSVTKFGCNVYDSIILGASSQFWPACQNLASEHRLSKVRRVLAIANLKNFKKLWNSRGTVELNRAWDETNAGGLASNMRLMDRYPPSELGERLLALGLLQTLNMASICVDVVYDNVNSGERVVAQNNALASIFGTHIDQLFDPVLDYSPQAIEHVYTPPSSPFFEPLLENTAIGDVMKELIAVQRKYTTGLLDILQDLIIPFRTCVDVDMIKQLLSAGTRADQVFLRTIDEIARINCVLHISLKSALPHGYTEVFKVLGGHIPYLYNAFVRHYANIRQYNQKYIRFLEQHGVLENSFVNQKSYSLQHVKSIVSGCLYELPRLKLVIMRLYRLILSEQKKLSTKYEFDNTQLDRDYRTVIETIDALGFEENESLTKRLIISPEGRLLVDLAKDWPEDLRCDWSTRKVVAVHELVASFSREQQILVVFTDKLLFLSVTYRARAHKGVRWADVLMNSLINKIPLPDLPHKPKLTVKYWCAIDRILAKSFDRVDGKCLSLTAYGGNYFKRHGSHKPTYSLLYDLLEDPDVLVTYNKIAESITKAQILGKSTSFHLFKHTEPDFSRYYCAHSRDEYPWEVIKSPVVILLNIGQEEIKDVFATNPQIGMVLALSSLNNITMQISGHNREQTYQVSETVSKEDLAVLLKTIIAKGMNSMIRSGLMTKELVLSGERLLEVFYNSQNIRDTTFNLPPLQKSLAEAATKKKDSGTDMWSQFAEYPLVDPIEGVKAKEPEHATKRVEAGSASSALLKCKKSAVLSILLKPSRKLKKPKLESAVQNAHSDETTACAGKKVVYKRLYKPDPLLREASRTSSVVSEEQAALSVSLNQDLLSEPKRLMKHVDLAEHRSVNKSVLKYHNSLEEASMFELTLPLGVVKAKRFPCLSAITAKRNRGALPVSPAPLPVQSPVITAQSSVIPAERPIIPVEHPAQAMDGAKEATEPKKALKIAVGSTQAPHTQSNNPVISGDAKTANATPKETASSRALPKLLTDMTEKAGSIEDARSRCVSDKSLINNTASSMKAVGTAVKMAWRFAPYQRLPNSTLLSPDEPNWIPWALMTEYSTDMSSLTSSTIVSELLQSPLLYELLSRSSMEFLLENGVSADAVAKLISERSTVILQEKKHDDSSSSSALVAEFKHQVDRNFNSSLNVGALAFMDHDCDASTIYTDYMPDGDQLSDTTTLAARLPMAGPKSLASEEYFASQLEDLACVAIHSGSSEQTLLSETQPAEEGPSKVDFGSLWYLSEVLNGTLTV